VEAEITQLAKMMRARRAAGVAPYTLLLGSSLSLTPAVRRAVCDSEDWEAFWETVICTSPEERRALMHEPLSQLDLQAGCDALAQLVGAGYFSVVLTLNLDDALDNALKTLPASEYRILVHGLVTSLEIVAALDRPTPRIKVVKLRGDVNTYKLPLTPEATFVFPPIWRKPSRGICAMIPSSWAICPSTTTCSGVSGREMVHCGSSQRRGTVSWGGPNVSAR